MPGKIEYIMIYTSQSLLCQTFSCFQPFRRKLKIKKNSYANNILKSDYLENN